MTVPGFADATDGDLAVLIADGPAQAAGVFSGEANAVLWTRQVVHDGGLRVVVLDPRVADDDLVVGPAGFQHVHAVAEQVAERHGIGAIDVAVLPGPAHPPVCREYAGCRLAALATDHGVVLLTDGALPAPDLAAALAQALDSVPWAERGALLLASGASAIRPGVADLAAALADLLDSLPTPASTSSHESTVHA
ncbi:hypothetical protein AB3X52_18490 [Nocardioides sp. DS6]|uniref:DUF4192 family protein n=1 Tax=Nocardioides eburneus TaxID=3231482 RepID=A0ABV3T329_9ACTN